MRTQEFNMMVKELKESKKLGVKELKECTKNQLIKLEDILMGMELNKSLEKTLDLIADMLVNPTPVVANKKEEPKKEEPKKEEPKKAPKKTDKKPKEDLVSLDYESLKIGDIITIYNLSILDTHTRIIYKDANLIVTIDTEEPVTYEFKREFISDGGYTFKNKKYYLKLSK